MPQRMNRQILLAARPVGLIKETDFTRSEAPLPELKDGEYLVRNRYLSLDPTNRGWMAEDTYLPAVKIGEVMRGAGVGTVVETRSPYYAQGTNVFGLIGWQEYFIGRPDDAMPLMPMMPLPAGTPLTAALSVYGITGMTAYFGLLEIGKPQAGETLVVSGAAGATGSVAGQIGKVLGCKVIGLAGSDEKCRWVTGDLGFDACINYKTEKVGTRLRELCPQGIDVYFDNVGGEILDTVLSMIRMKARIVLCGAISQYNATARPAGPSNYINLIIQRGRMEGFIVTDFFPQFPEAAQKLGEWVAAGRIKHAEDVVDGLDQAPKAINRLFSGENTGKLLVKVWDG